MSYKPTLEGLENRLAPYATVTSGFVPPRMLHGGEDGVVMAQFRVSPQHAVFVGSVDLDAAPGTDAFAGLENCTLRADVDRNGTFETLLDQATIDQALQEVHFEMPGRSLRTLALRRYPLDLQVTADIREQPSGSRLGLKLDEVGLRTLSGMRVPQRYIRYGGAGPTLHTFSQATGSLFVTQASVPPSGHLLGGTAEVVQRFNFRAVGEAIEATVLHFGVLGGARSVDRLELYRDGEENPFAFATIGATGSDIVPTMYNAQPVTTFTARMLGQELVIPEGQSINITVKARIKPDSVGGVSGDSIQVVLIGDPSRINNSTGEGAIHARGLASGNSLAGNDGDSAAEGEVFIGTWTAAPNCDILSPFHAVVMAEVTSVTNANPDADGTAVPSGEAPIGQFRVTAAWNANLDFGPNAVVGDQFAFVVYATNVALDEDSFTFSNKADPATRKSCVVTVLEPGVYRVICAGLATSAVNTTIASGTSQTFMLSARITNTKVNPALPASLQVVADFGPDFRWFDRDPGTSVSYVDTDLPNTLIRSTLYQS